MGFERLLAATAQQGKSAETEQGGGGWFSDDCAGDDNIVDVDRVTVREALNKGRVEGSPFC